MSNFDYVKLLIFQNISESWNSTEPTLSACFREVAFYGIPSIFFCILFAIHIFHLYRKWSSKRLKRPLPLPISIFLYVKLTLSGILLITNIIELFYGIISP